MSEKSRILYVEDDETLSFVTKDNLELNGYKVDHCMDGESAVETFFHNSYDLCILDVMLPKMDGFAVAEKIRATDPNVPILFLTAKSMKEDRIHGLKLGADDYITKPFSIEELILKIEVFLRRKYVTVSVNDQYKIGLYNFDYRNLTLSLQSDHRSLTQKEADLLKMLLDHKNNVVKRSLILEKLWGEDDYFLGRSMDVFISRLRKYLSGDDKIKLDNIHGVGFKLIIEN
ncbi:MAG TPA: response regulator transcription factor [Saprospiraceae bacterium]|jgi:DNA-binding response OmpR family regulator|nr:response regulator transcription factor [Saprospiraceae bacterium]MBK6666324.1 response regulator transcription factor [Saprospiraceae bacterium]MBK7701118.1 response regulator transcription factor [Saprospiraceae bacterium]MBK8827014.1 response regulator transcription factor [Saprospiraceae bacterium]MBK9584186.1 response regulator transcription factor [Saprospiraceae bacterium]